MTKENPDFDDRWVEFAGSLWRERVHKHFPFGTSVASKEVLQGSQRPSFQDCTSLATACKGNTAEWIVAGGYFPQKLLAFCCVHPAVILDLCERISLQPV